MSEEELGAKLLPRLVVRPTEVMGLTDKEQRGDVGLAGAEKKGNR